MFHTVYFIWCFETNILQAVLHLIAVNSDSFNAIEGVYIGGLVQDCSDSSALAMELPQSCTKLSICCYEETYSCNS